MKNFLVIYHANSDAMQESMISTPEEREKSMQQWMAWSEKCGDKLVDFGAPLMNGQQLNPGGKSMRSNREVIGYSMLKAENMKEAQNLLKDHPHLDWRSDCAIEVHETMPLPGM